ncbi:MAG: shikimate dehydrogenase [Sphingopyxis sp.]|nr:shikimate dehydrogenase [Sphingopyxis sp.]
MTVSRPFAEVIGDPIAHSKSPLIHNFWLAELGINAEYRACHVRPDGLAAYIAARRDDPLWRGCNVTLPHKQAVIEHVADPGGVEQSIGAANTIFWQGDDLACTNTDAAGFYAPLADVPLADAPVVVVGSGGAARAVLFALAQIGVGSVSVLARNALKASALLAHFGLKGQARTLDAPLPPAALLVNASSLGMAGQPPLDLDLGNLPGDALVYDLVYAPLETPLLAAARARGLATIDGLDMLIGQAAVAFELFFGAAPPDDPDDRLREILLAP